MKKSTKNFIMVVGILIFLSGIYGIVFNGVISNILLELSLGIGLIVSVYFDGKSEKN